MNNFRRFLTVAAFMTLSGFSVANAQPVTAGEYKLTIGRTAPCNVTLQPDGTVSAGDCVRLANIGHWRPAGSDLELADKSGTLLAVLHTEGDAYAGKTYPENHTVLLTPTAQTAANTH